MNKAQVSEFTTAINQNAKFHEHITDFVAAVDANIMYTVQSLQKMQAEITLNGRYAKVAAKKGNLWNIAGYAYGRTSNDDPYILLYPAHPKMVHKVTRVYDHQFYDLPRFVSTIDIPADAPDNNPTKEQAAKKKIYYECPEFEIATIDGKETNMGPEQRFYMTVNIPSESILTPSAPASPPKLEQVSTAIDFNNAPEDETINSAPITKTNTEADTIETTEETIAVTELNNLLGIGEPDPQPQAPYLYSDGNQVANDENLIAIYLAYWQQNEKIVANGPTLQSWYKRNSHHLNEKELI